MVIRDLDLFDDDLYIDKEPNPNGDPDQDLFLGFFAMISQVYRDFQNYTILRHSWVLFKDLCLIMNEIQFFSGSRTLKRSGSSQGSDSF